MSCGFGAVLLFFFIINHQSEVREQDVTRDLSGEVSLMETEVQLERLHRVKLQNSLSEIQQELVTAQGRADQLITELETDQEELATQEEETAARRAHVNDLIAEIKRLDEELGSMDEQEGGVDTRAFFGIGDRQYLTGLRIGGERVLILLDSSASMLDSSIVNIIRRRNLPDDQKKRAEKWNKALLTVDWLSTQIPTESQFQIYSFNTTAKPVLEDTAGQWLDVGEDPRVLNRAVAATREVVPGGGSRLHAALEAIYSLSPLPDNIFLLVDSLPTQGEQIATKRDTVTGNQRERYFNRAVADLPAGIPVNVILYPMEGDPMAASWYWKLATITGGSFMSPSRDWP
jgi:cell division protein FtsB